MKRFTIHQALAGAALFCSVAAPNIACADEILFPYIITSNTVTTVVGVVDFSEDGKTVSTGNDIKASPPTATGGA